MGSGPTYTIAWFNCGRALDNLKSATAATAATAAANRSKTETQTYFDDDDEGSDTPASAATDDDDDDDNDDADMDYNDFGIYVCKAINSNLRTEDMETDAESETQRYIKINPSGAPVPRSVQAPASSLSSSMSSSSLTSLSFEEIANRLMVLDETMTSVYDAQEVYVAASLGSTLTLSCIMEPMPRYDNLIWLKDNELIVLGGGGGSSGDRHSSLRIKHDNVTKALREEATTYLTATSGSASLVGNGGDVRHHQRQHHHHHQDVSISQRGATLVNDVSSLVRTVLIIRDVKPADLGVYKCRSSNAHGARSVTFVVRETNVFGAVKTLFLFLSVRLVLKMCCLILLCSGF